MGAISPSERNPSKASEVGDGRRLESGAVACSAI